MTNKWNIISVLLIILLYSSCNTYTTYYSKTYTSTPNRNKSKVHRLDFSNKNVESLAEYIVKNKNLKMLNLSNTKISNLDNIFIQLGKHTQIEILILDSLDISRLPKSIKTLSHLKQLSLSYNPKLNLEDTFSKISDLPIEFLNLKGNNIAKLPDNTTSLHHIKDLNLSYNILSEKHNYTLLGELPNLYSLWIDHNNLDQLPETIGALDQVRFLYIDHNNLNVLPNSISAMKKTWVIHAGYNQFTELPSAFTKMKSLFMVHINNNNIKSISEAYEKEKYPLAGLILDNNPLLDSEKEKGKKLFKGFFLLSFEQNQ
ncbi:leucine-rich repeat domain-containing protein [Aquimarina algiphila]|uniref:Disease resistance R13L4/SHOC-2-like LRR domain-containing protein n=1 Tax=Aquimarina algiphila TaxID=2047982 RepID=A0A554VRY7_9FLAO|nr:hypothetical protein [Aquimarina algiphila]TSE11455.1 hypothetical protein FOF46_00290 [Aquimarina algiphila]